MEIYRLLHLSDLHIAGHSFFINPSISTSNPTILEKIVKLTGGKWKKKLDAVIITGDLSSMGRPKDFEKVTYFINKLKSNGLKVIIVPGNHDRFNRFPHHPGSVKFESYFNNEWDVGFGGIKSISLPQKQNMPKIILICADFTLKEKNDASSLGSYLGQGKVYPERLKALVEETKLKKISQSIIIWILHFAPNDKNHLIVKEKETLIEDMTLIEQAKELDVQYIFCGHTHKKKCFKFKKHTNVNLFCAGTATCDNKEHKEDVSIYVHYIKKENNLLKVNTHDYKWEGTNFLRKKIIFDNDR